MLELMILLLFCCPVQEAEEEAVDPLARAFDLFLDEPGEVLRFTDSAEARWTRFYLSD